MINIYVSKKDIVEGKQCSVGHCPVALAMGRKLNKLVHVYPSIAYVFPNAAHKNIAQAILIPPKATQFTYRFDLGKSVKPFSFRIRYDSSNS